MTITAVDLACPSIVKRGLGREKKNGHLKARRVDAAERNSIKEVDCIQAFLKCCLKIEILAPCVTPLSLVLIIIDLCRLESFGMLISSTASFRSHEHA